MASGVADGGTLVTSRPLIDDAACSRSHPAASTPFLKGGQTEHNGRFGHVGDVAPHLFDATCKSRLKKTQRRSSAKTFLVHFSLGLKVGTSFFYLFTLFCKHINYHCKVQPSGETCLFASLLFCLSQDLFEKIPLPPLRVCCRNDVTSNT